MGCGRERRGFNNISRWQMRWVSGLFALFHSFVPSSNKWTDLTSGPVDGECRVENRLLSVPTVPCEVGGDEHMINGAVASSRRLLVPGT